MKPSTQPQNLTPMEQVLVASLTELQERLSALENSSLEESALATKAFDGLSQQLLPLPHLTQQLTELSQRLEELEPTLIGITRESNSLTKIYNDAATAFNSMKAQYTELASEVQKLREFVE